MQKANVTFTAIPQIIQICSPLFSELEFCDFNYACVYHDGSRAHLGVNEELMNYAFGDVSKLTFDCQQIPWYAELNSTQGIMLFSNFAAGLQDYQHRKSLMKHIYFEKQEFGHADTILLYKWQSNFIELLEFSCNENFSFVDIHLHDFNQLLDHFYYYFKEKACHLIKESRANKILQPISSEKQLSTLEQKTNSRYKKILQNTKVNRFYLETENGNSSLYLTAREMTVAKQLIKTPNVKSIAKYLNSSPRTIEKHIVTLKDKLNCASKVTLIELLNHYLILN